MSDKSEKWFARPFIVNLSAGVVVAIVSIPTAVLAAIIAARMGVSSPGHPPADSMPPVPVEKMADPPGAGADDSPPPALPALERFSSGPATAWGPIAMGMSRIEIERKVGLMQCRPVDRDGFRCLCLGEYEGVEFHLEMKSPQTGDDANVCERSDAEVTSQTILLSPAERAAPHEAIVDALRARLPQFQLLRGPEPSARGERSRHKPTYTFADGMYNLVLDYEWDAVRLSLPVRGTGPATERVR